MPRYQATELREERASLHAKMKEVLEREKFGAEDQTEFDALEKDFDAKSEQVRAVEKVEGYAPEQRTDQKIVTETGEEVEGPKLSALEQKREALKSDEYATAFESFIRAKGQFGMIDAESRAALQVGTDTEGGFTVPDEFHRTLVESQREFGIMRQLATVITTSDSGDLLIPKVDAAETAAYTAEEAAYTQSESTFAQTILGSFKLGLIQKVSDELIHDSAFDVLGFIARRSGQAIGIKENNSFIAGASGSTTTPEGIATKATVGKTTATNSAITTDELIDTFHSVLSPYRAKSVWIFNDSTIKVIRKLKDTTNQYLWQPGLQAGVADTLLGRPVYADPDVAAVATTAVVGVFGDISSYWIRDVEGVTVKVLNELYAANGQVGYRVSRRTDGDLVDTAGVKSLKMAT